MSQFAYPLRLALPTIFRGPFSCACKVLHFDRLIVFPCLELLDSDRPIRIQVRSALFILPNSSLGTLTLFSHSRSAIATQRYPNPISHSRSAIATQSMGMILNLQNLSQPSQALFSHSPNQFRFPPGTLKTSPYMRNGFTLTHATVRAATLYDVLDLSPNVGLSDIKRAYRQMARRYHPDVCPSDQAEESTRRFIEIQEAYETLSNPQRRAVYDHAIAMGRGSAANGRMPWSPRDTDCEPADWKSQWESQLFEFKRQSSMREQRTDSWAARVRRQNGSSTHSENYRCPHSDVHHKVQAKTGYRQ